MRPQSRPSTTTEIDIDAADAHVAQVFAVDRRDAAQMRVGEVERLARGVEFGHDRDRA